MDARGPKSEFEMMLDRLKSVIDIELKDEEGVSDAVSHRIMLEQLLDSHKNRSEQDKAALEDFYKSEAGKFIKNEAVDQEYKEEVDVRKKENITDDQGNKDITKKAQEQNKSEVDEEVIRQRSTYAADQERKLKGKSISSPPLAKSVNIHSDSSKLAEKKFLGDFIRIKKMM